MTASALSNAKQALQQLQAFLVEPIVSDRDKAGVIQAFEFTFEAAWKLLQKLAAAQGLEAPSPKKALAAAFRLGVIDDELLWLDMLKDRNLTTHTYQAALAEAIFAQVRDRYAAALTKAISAAEEDEGGYYSKAHKLIGP